MTLRQAILDKWSEKYGKLLYQNDQGMRVSGQPYGADPSKQTLTFLEFLDSFFGDARLNADSDKDELVHVGEVLWDYRVR
jgi:hypothetical protein